MGPSSQVPLCFNVEISPAVVENDFLLKLTESKYEAVQSVEEVWSKSVTSSRLVFCNVRWSPRVTEEHKLRVFENRVLRRIFGTKKREREMGGWRKLHNEELHNLYSSPSIIKIIKSRGTRWAGHVARMGEKKNVYRLLVGKPHLLEIRPMLSFLSSGISPTCPLSDKYQPNDTLL
jgi:hypothetical protein